LKKFRRQIRFLKSNQEEAESHRQISEEADLIQIPEDENPFSEALLSMGEVADMFSVNQSLLRFWEAEFSILQQKKIKRGSFISAH